MLRRNHIFKSAFKTFNCKTADGKIKKFVFEDLQPSKYEEFLDFKVKYYVPEEATHRVSGLHKSVDGVAEYRKILMSRIMDPKFQIFICRPEDEDTIVSFSSSKLVTKNDTPINYEQLVKSPDLKHFYKIINKWNGLYPSSVLMSKYGVDSLYEDYGGGVHPDYRKHGIAKNMTIFRRELCVENNIPMISLWATAVGTQVALDRDNWELLMEIKKQELEKELGAEFKFPVPETFKFYIYRLNRDS